MTMHQRDYVEKRDFIRMPVNAAASIQLQDNPNSLQCVCRDLSAAGMLLEVDTEIPLHTAFIVTLPSQTEGFNSLIARVIATRCVDYQGDRFLVGARIDQILN